MSRSLRLLGYVGIGVLSGLLVAAMAIFIITRTDWGMNRARGFAVAWLADRVHGELHVGRLSGPGLLSGVMIHDFAITDSAGRGFVRADSLELNYNWRTLLAGRIELNRVVLHQPLLELEQLPGDSIWNYEHIFADTTPSVAEAGRSLILFQDAHVHNGTVILRTPLEPVASMEPDDTARILLEQVPGGLARVLRFEAINARLNRVIWETPVEPGQLFDVASVSARGFVQREPFTIQDAHGTVTARDTVIAIDFRDVTMPGTQADILGTFVQREGKNILDFRVNGRRFAFRDLQWLYPRLPDEGGGSVILRIQSRPEGTLFLAEDARIQAPGTVLAGTVGLVTGDSLYFTSVNLRASPLDVRLLEQILPGGLPVEGLLIGTVEVRGPISALETSGDVRVAGGTGAGSEIEWNGVLDLRAGDVAARSLHANVRNLELALISALNPRVQLDGRVTGEVQGSGNLRQLMFQASLTHDGRAGARTAFSGSGTVRRDGDLHVDISADATAATFKDLAEYVPQLRGLQGELRGPVRLAGTARDLHFDANLTTDGGPVRLEGRVLHEGTDRRVVGQASGSALRLSALRAGLPEFVLSGTASFDITGSAVATAVGTAQLVLDSARLRSLPIRQSVIGGRLADGMFTVDSAHVDARAGLARARGTIALVDTRQGSLEFGFVSESLTPLEEFLMGARDTTAVEPRLAGRIDATGTMTGWIGGFDINASARGSELVYDRISAARAHAELELRRVRGAAPAPLRIALTGDSVGVFSHTLQNASFNAVGQLDSIRIAGSASSVRHELLQLRADVLRPGDDLTAVRVAELRLGGGSPWQLTAPAAVALQRGDIRVDGVELRRADGGRINASGRLAWARSREQRDLPLDFGIQVEGVPFTELLRARRSTAIGAGELDGTLRIAGTALDPVVEGELNGRNLRYDDVRIDHAFAELSYSALGLDAHAEAQYDGRSILTGGGRIPIDFRFTGVDERRLDEPLRFTIVADSLPPGLPLGLVDGFSRTHGRIDGTVAFSGTTLDPALSGGFTIGNGSMDWDVTGVGYRNVDGAFTLERDRLLRVNLTAQATDPRPSALGGDGNGTITGTISLSTLTNPRFDLRLIADQVYAARRRDVEATVTGELRLAGLYRRPELSGSIRVEEGALYLDEVYRQYLIVPLDSISAVDTSVVAMTPVLGTMIANARNPFLANLIVNDLNMSVGSNTWLRSAEMDVEVTGDLTVALDRADKDLRLTGSLNVARGTYTLYYPPFQSRRFNVRQGTIEFPGIPGIDPNLSISAAYRARNTQREPLDVLAVVSGSLQNPRVRLTSDAQPPISESDLASYLFFGVPSWQVGNNGVATGDVRAVRNFGLQAITPSVLGYASSGLQTLAQSVGVDYAAITSAEISPERRATSGAVASFLANTQLEVGTYVFGSSAFLAVSKWLGSSNIDPAVRIEWRFRPEFSFELFTDQRIAGTPGFGIRPEAEPKRVFGFFLFREWGF